MGEEEVSRSRGRLYIDELVTKFPRAAAKTLGRIAYKGHPEYWETPKACYNAVRRALGVGGNLLRSSATAPREPIRSWSDVIPESIVQLEDWKAFDVPEEQRTLVISDLQMPFHDVSAIEVALDYGVKRDLTHILINGDAFDHFAQSDFVKDPRQKDFAGEVKAGKQFLSGLRARFPDARIIFKQGNHEERYERYMRVKAPEFLGIPEFEWHNLFGLTDNNIELVTHKRPIRLGKLNVIHGHEYTFNISNPVNPARGMYLRAKTHVMGGHFHQTSQHSEKSLEQTVISAWSTGCLCDLHPEYRPLNNWNQGFAFVEVDANGRFEVDNLKIISGKAYT